MNSVFERALGSAYAELHPAIRDRYALTSTDNRRCVGYGRMRSIRRNPFALPVLWAGPSRNLLFPETGTDVPFRVRTVPFDENGVESVAYIRWFDVGPGRRFDAYMRYDEARDCIVDALGTHRTLQTELRLTATQTGALRIETGDQWIAYRGRSVAVPNPLRADVDVTERYDDDQDRFEIAVEISNPLVGFVFGYDGWFTVEYEDCSGLRPEDVPANVGELR
jgi:hypothetical protein